MQMAIFKVASRDSAGGHGAPRLTRSMPEGLELNELSTGNRQ